MHKTDTIKGISKQSFVHCVWAEEVDIDVNTAQSHDRHDSKGPQVMEVNSTLTRVIAAISKGLSFH